MATTLEFQPAAPPSEAPASAPIVPGTCRLFNVDEYARLYEAGILKPGERVELLGGEVRLMSPMGPGHATLVRRLNAELLRQCGDGAIVSPQCPLQLDAYSAPEPDLVLLRMAPDQYANRHPQASDALLAIEVSDTSITFDRNEKLPRYAAAGIPEAWLVDLERQQIEQYSQPNQGIYERKEVRKIDDEIRSLGTGSPGIPAIVLAVKSLFT